MYHIKYGITSCFRSHLRAHYATCSNIQTISSYRSYFVITHTMLFVREYRRQYLWRKCVLKQDAITNNIRSRLRWKLSHEIPPKSFERMRIRDMRINPITPAVSCSGTCDCGLYRVNNTWGNSSIIYIMRIISAGEMNNVSYARRERGKGITTNWRGSVLK